MLPLHEPIGFTALHRLSSPFTLPTFLLCVSCGSSLSLELRVLLNAAPWYSKRVTECASHRDQALRVTCRLIHRAFPRHLSRRPLLNTTTRQTPLWKTLPSQFCWSLIFPSHQPHHTCPTNKESIDNQHIHNKTSEHTLTDTFLTCATAFTYINSKPKRIGYTIMSPSLLQLQTQAGTGTKPIFVGQGIKPKHGSDDSITSLSSSASSATSTRKPSLDVVRCSRCQRSLSIDTAMPTQSHGAVRFGLNSYYCGRCANLVGFIK